MNILVLCTGNSCRSQMLHGFLKQYAPESSVYSAGVEVHGVNPKAVFVMSEKGIDLSSHTSNHVDEYSDVQFVHVITVCDNAKESCPIFPSTANQTHRSFPDPAQSNKSGEALFDEFRKVRDQLEAFAHDFVQKFHLK